MKPPRLAREKQAQGPALVYLCSPCTAVHMPVPALLYVVDYPWVCRIHAAIVGRLAVHWLRTDLEFGVSKIQGFQGKYMKYELGQKMSSYVYSEILLRPAP